MSGYLVTDTNSAIKLAFLKDKFFTDGFISVGKAVLYHKVVRNEVLGHIRGGYKKRIEEQLEYIRDCEFYVNYEVDDIEFVTYEMEFIEKKEEIAAKGGYVGTKDNDETLLYLAIINDQILITNEYALTSLAKAMNHPVLSAEDLALQAFDENKLELKDLQNLVDEWNNKNEKIMADKKEEFIKRGIKV